MRTRRAENGTRRTGRGDWLCGGWAVALRRGTRTQQPKAQPDAVQAETAVRRLIGQSRLVFVGASRTSSDDFWRSRPGQAKPGTRFPLVLREPMCLVPRMEKPLSFRGFSGQALCQTSVPKTQPLCQTSVPSTGKCEQHHIIRTQIRPGLPYNKVSANSQGNQEVTGARTLKTEFS